jgi:hypothetical protein
VHVPGELGRVDDQAERVGDGVQVVHRLHGAPRLARHQPMDGQTDTDREPREGVHWKEESRTGNGEMKTLSLAGGEGR